MEHELWNALPAGTRAQVDALIARERTLNALMVLRAADPPIPLAPGQRLLAWRCAELGLHFGPRPSPPLDPARLTDLAARIADLDEPPVAVEAAWDGDTFGWMIHLSVITGDPETRHALATIRHGTDMRVFNGQVPPWPEAEEASRAGRELADRFGVPFRFDSPDEPDLR
ncbi:hypothetical protein HII36_27235 [Nonomuraea sp. NN258]|uniref:hypothetical protein n=1 Tax=Nonomuraea antri TaxID=2730852 RepID=UPI00156992F7|nr:hypothetical protein [Nonomuraea antri]NRQ35496.1 hypothetical protein [Nonomuraea antri]